MSVQGMPNDVAQGGLAAAPNSIQDIYPEYSARLLDVMAGDYLEIAEAHLQRTGRAHYALRHAFAAEPLTAAQRERIKGGKVCCMSLFFKPTAHGRHQNLPATDGAGRILEEELTRAPHPAFVNTKRQARSFLANYLEPVLSSNFGDWIPLVYLAQDLAMLAPLLESHGWVVVRMRHSSVFHSPGAMWRYLGFNLDCRACYFQDTDRRFLVRRANKLVEWLKEHDNTTLVRPLQHSSLNDEVALILGNDFAVNPANVPFDAQRMMMGYLVLNILHEDRIANFCHEPLRGCDETRVAFRQERALRGHFGPLPHERTPHRCFPYYCFDEQWLKEFVYYQMKDGAMMTFGAVRTREGDVTQKLDLEHQKKVGNWIFKGYDIRSLGQEGAIIASGGNTGAGRRPADLPAVGRKASFEEYAFWYLGRERRKGYDFEAPATDAEAVAMMKRWHAGKMRAYFPHGKWRLTWLEDREVFERLIFLDDAMTRSEGLIREGSALNYRLLVRVAAHGVAMNYGENCSSTNLRKYYQELAEGKMALRGSQRLVLCDPFPGELKWNPKGSFYLQDGTARALAYMMLILECKVPFQPVEVFHCAPSEAGQD